MKIKRVEILASKPSELLDFYHQKLGFSLVEGEDFAVECGDSVLAFAQGELEGVYHFAFNIPANDMQLAVGWLKSLAIELLPFDGKEIVPFVNWKAAGIYFYDPAGNIVELIGRERMRYVPSASFDAKSIRSISEMGLATKAFEKHIDQLQSETGIPVFGNRSTRFCALGDDAGLFIVVNSHVKKWIPNMEDAPPLPFNISIEENRTRWEIQFQPGLLTITPAG